MNIKKNKGITLVALVITVIIILVIGAITVYEGSKLVDEAKYEDVKTNMLLIQAEVKNFAEQAKFEGKKIEDLIGEEEGKGITVDGKTLFFTEPDSDLNEAIENVRNKTNAQIDLYQIKTDMRDLNLNNIDSTKYLISIDISEQIEVEVCFLPGILDNKGITQFFLSDIQKTEEQ